MVIALGIVLLVLGLILLTGAVDLPASWDDAIAGETLGWILTGVGALAIVIGLIATIARARRKNTVVRRDDTAAR